MNYQEIEKMIDTLKNTSSTISKKLLLEEYLKDPDFGTVVKYALDGTKHFNIKKLPKPKEPIEGNIFEFLDILAENQGASNEEKQHLSNLCSFYNAEKIILKILKKSLRCGVNSGLINQVIPGFIETVPYQRCSTLKKKRNIIYPAAIQPKLDGGFAYAFNTEEKKFLSRKGMVYYFKDPELYKELSNCWKDLVYAGEFLVLDEDMVTILPRKKGNGILNKALKKTITEEESKRIIFITWLYIPINKYKISKYKVPYFKILKNLPKAVLDSKRIFPIETIIINSFEEAQMFAEKEIKKGGEGAVVKNLAEIWKDATSVQQIKIKAEKECELKIIGWNYGEENKKYSSMMGNIICQSSCKQLIVNVGTGFSDEERKENWDKHIGKIATIQFNELITSKSKDTKSLFLPRFVEIREDKTKADSLKIIEEL